MKVPLLLPPTDVRGEADTVQRKSKKEKHLISPTGEKEKWYGILGLFLRGGGIWGLFPAPEKKSYECVIFSDTPPPR